MSTTTLQSRAAVARAVGAPLELTTIAVDPPATGEVRLKVSATGICHSDLSILNGTLRSEFPVVLGHEAAGIIESVGDGVSHVEPGDAVLISLTPACGHCEFCARDMAHLCVETGKTINNGTMLDGHNRLREGTTELRQIGAIGSFSEYTVVPAGMAVPVDPALPLDEICIIGCGVTTGLGAALFTAKVESGTSVAVIGCGGVGLSIIQGARISGATTIIAVDPVASRRALARELGATHEVDAAAEDPIRAVRKIVRGGVHYAFEAVGRPDTTAAAWSMVRTAGLCVVVGISKVDQPIPFLAGGFLQEKRITGSVAGSCRPQRDFPRFLDLHARGELRLQPMITGRITLDQVNGALDAMNRGEGARSVIVYG